MAWRFLEKKQLSTKGSIKNATGLLIAVIHPDFELHVSTQEDVGNKEKSKTLHVMIFLL